jgi:hypothetical protein
MTSKLHLRFVGAVDARLRAELLVLGWWLRRHYEFRATFLLRFVHARRLIDFDGTKCAARWWQSSRRGEPFTAEIAVASFAGNLRREGDSVAYPTVVAAAGRMLKHYFDSARDVESSQRSVDAWGDRLLDAYCDDKKRPPAP